MYFSNSSKAGVLGRFAARWAGVPVIVHTVHGWSFHDHMSGATRKVFIVLERLLARVTTGRTNPRDLSFVGRTLAGLPKLKAKLTARKSKLLCRLEADLDLCPEVRSKLESALVSECPLTSREGGFIRDGFDEELDRLRELAAGGKQWIAKYQAEIVKTSGIPNLKVGYNKVFGYYIEVTNTHRDRVPDHFIRKQTLKNAERYITPDLKEYEEQVLTADEKAKDLEYELFLELRDVVAASASISSPLGSTCSISLPLKEAVVTWSEVSSRYSVVSSLSGNIDW